MSYSICKAISCPALIRNGCSRYAASGNCHLLRGRTGIRDNQYQLFADEGVVDLDQLRAENETFFAKDKSTLVWRS